MEDLLVKIKDRISEKDSPLKTVKAVVDAIGMSEAGFYRMVQRNNTKYGTILALAKALDVEESYFTGTANKKESVAVPSDFGNEVLLRMQEDMREMRHLFEEQLMAKERQIEKLIDLLGKLKGAIKGPLSTDVIDDEMELYSDLAQSNWPTIPLTSQKSKKSAAKLVAPN